jgi:RNA polymerase sigma factor (sigma-70 family)
MMSGGPALMQRYLDASAQSDEDALLAELVFENAAPVIRKTIARRLMGSSEQDRDDVAGDVTLDLITRLKKLKREGGVPIERFIAYAAVSAHNGCDQYLRQRYPQRHRLKNRLRYLLGKLPSFAIWENAERGWVCGKNSWRDLSPITPEPGLASHLASPDRGAEMVLIDVFERTAAPIEFDALVDIFADFWGIRDCAVALEFVVDTSPSIEPAPDDVIAQRESLQYLWSGIMELPQPQRAALLLNLRDPQSGSPIWLLPSSGIASVRGIAELVGIPAGEFADLWSRLPVTDMEIAERLGVTRQQVINLRQAARQRLARRLRANVSGSRKEGAATT